MPSYLNAREFLLAVEARYRALDAYQDHGCVRHAMRPPRAADLRAMLRDRDMPASARESLRSLLQASVGRAPQTGRVRRAQAGSELTFTTAFQSPARFRFAFQSPHPYAPLRHLVTEHVCGSDGQAAYLHMRTHRGERLKHAPSLRLAVAGAKGISGGAAHTIAALLFEDCGGFQLKELRRLRLRGQRVLDGVACLGVTGRHPRDGRRLTAWFGREDLLLRRVWEPHRGHEELRLGVSTRCPDPAQDFAIPAEPA